MRPSANFAAVHASVSSPRRLDSTPRQQGLPVGTDSTAVSKSERRAVHVHSPQRHVPNTTCRDGRAHSAPTDIAQRRQPQRSPAPVLSTAEDVTSVGLVFVSLLLPLLVLVALAAVAFTVFQVWRWRRRRAQAEP
ncbi:MAG: hypothetical protein K0R68_2207 [Mycobacterium sp.]|nr:hypothetical protein [Mycobacterium sp.]